MMKFILQLFVFAILLISQSNAFSKNITIGYGWTNSALPVKNQELFYSGFTLGLFENLNHKNKPKINIIQKYDSSGDVTSPRRVVNELLKVNPDILVGFTTSHDAMMIRDILTKKAKDKLVLFIGSSHQDIADFGPNVFTTGETMISASEAMLRIVDKKFRGLKGLVIQNPKSIFSVNNVKFIKDKLSESKLIDYANLNVNQLLDSEALLSIQKSKYKFIIFTTYAETASGVMEQLKKLKVDLPIIANSSWTAIDILRRFVSERSQPIYISSLWIAGSAVSLPFEKVVFERYGLLPNAELSYGYDAGKIIADTINRSIKNDKPVISAFKSSKCFSKTSTGTICFDEAGGHSKRKINNIEFKIDNIRFVN